MIKYPEKVKEYFINKYDGYDYRRGWIKCNCPICDEEHKFGVNLEKDWAHCFKCGYASNIHSCIMKAEKLDSFPKYVSYINSLTGVEIRKTKAKEFISPDRILPEGFKLLKYGDSLIARAARKHIEGRGFTVKSLSRKGIGYVDTKGKYFGYLILPIKVDNKVTFFQTRKIIGTGPKFNNPTWEDLGIGKSLVLFNGGILLSNTKVYLVESIFNALTLGNQAIAMLGKALSSRQRYLLMNSPVEEVIIMLDPDAYKEALKLGMELCTYKKVKVVLLPDDKDVNDIGKEAALALEEKTEYGRYPKLLMAWKNLKSRESILQRSY